MRSKKGLGLDGILEILAELGRPVIVATDKSNPPELVRKVSANFGAILVFPSEDLPLEYKREVARKFEVKDDHQRDALSAALFAYKKYKPKIEKIRAELRRREPEIIENVLKGETIAEALEIKEREKKKEMEEEIKALKKEVEKQKRLIRELKKKLKAKPRVLVVKELEKSKVREAFLESQLKNEKKERERLESELAKIERLLELALKGDVDIFYKGVPPEYRVLARLGNIIFAREKTRESSVDEKTLEKLVEEYRRVRARKSREPTE